MTAPDAAPALELCAVTVRYGHLPALDRVSLALRHGEITCVLGENGSGKSTLVAVVSGTRRPDEGDLRMDGRPMRLRTPRRAREAGIATVWQDLAVAPLLPVWRNFVLGAEPTVGPWPLRRVDVAAARRTTVEGMRRVGVSGFDPDQPANALRAGARHSLAVARALHHGSRVLVFDEPTAPLTVGQHSLVLQSLVAARREGLAVLFVTNNPRYAHLVGDRFVLLAGGRVAGSLTRDDVSAEDLTRLLAGGDELTGLTEALTAAHPELGAR